MVFSMLEIFKMYNGFAQRNILLLMDESAYTKLLTLYQEGRRLGVAIIIEAFNQAANNNRDEFMYTIPVPSPDHLYTIEYLVICTLSKNRFYVHLIA